MKRTLAASLALLLLVGLSACSTSESSSEAHLVIDADEALRAETASLRVVLAGRPRGSVVWEEAPPRIFEQTPEAWPVELTFSPKNGDSSREFSVSALAFDDDRTELVAKYAVDHFTRGKKEMRLMLTADCLSRLVQCTPEQTCDEGQCIDVHPGTDAGEPDGGPADASTLDASTLDAGPSNGDSCVPHAVYRDADNDDFGVASSRLMTCAPIDGYVRSDGDCDDASGAVRPGIAEACDGVDNNCNMQTDEGCACTTGATRACGTDTGECTAGVQRCTAGVWSATCEGERPATSETCDGADNDCDGSADDSATCSARPNTSSACAAGACAYTCRTDYGDCDSTPGNGCEATLLTDTRNCGRCGNSCRAGACTAGECETGGGAIWCAAGSFCDISTFGAPSARKWHTAVWTGSEMLVWGGFGDSGLLNTGARYNPTTNTWTALSTAGAPSARYLHTAAWTGSEMLVWGGIDPGYVRLNTGARYNPSTNSWTAIPTTDAPFGRYGYTAVWTGSEMLVWGGEDDYGRPSNTGARYNPSANRWTVLPTTGAPAARSKHVAVWTGSEMLVWSGREQVRDGWSEVRGSGARYNPSVNTWTALPAYAVRDAYTSASSETHYTAVWSGSEMIGIGETNGWATRARYNPITETWTALPTSGAPPPHNAPSIVWTGSEMLVWGGLDAYNTGARYNPTTDSWTALPIAGAPSARTGFTAVWTGSEVLFFGGIVGESPPYILTNTGGVWRP